jgi:ABC-type antimicrobial peptide transport system permease subunit
LGAVLAVTAGFLLRASMFGLTTSHPEPYVIAVIVQALVVALASWSPAVRASRSNPLEILRSE